jgi:hypothetical protein
MIHTHGKSPLPLIVFTIVCDLRSGPSGRRMRRLLRQCAGRMTIPGPCTEVVRNPLRLRHRISQAACQVLLLDRAFEKACEKCRREGNSPGKSRCVFERFIRDRTVSDSRPAAQADPKTKLPPSIVCNCSIGLRLWARLVVGSCSRKRRQHSEQCSIRTRSRTSRLLPRPSRAPFRGTRESRSRSNRQPRCSESRDCLARWVLTQTSAVTPQTSNVSITRLCSVSSRSVW